MRAFTQNRTNVAIGGCVVPNGRFIKFTVNNASSGNNDAPAVPAGKIWLVLSYTIYQTTGSAITVQPQVKIGGTYYKIVTPTSLSSSSNGGFAVVWSFQAGDIFSFNTASAGVNIRASIFECDADCGIVPVRLLSLTSGDNTLYTCPAGKSAAFLDANSNGFILASTVACKVFNDSGGSRNYFSNLVSSGGSAGTGNRLCATLAVTTNNSGTALSTGPMLGAGDFFSLNTDASTATQTAWATVLELP